MDCADIICRFISFLYVWFPSEPNRRSKYMGTPEEDPVYRNLPSYTLDTPMSLKEKASGLFSCLYFSF